MPRNLLLVLLLFVYCCPVARAKDEAVPAAFEVSVVITPGKPGAPSEAIKLFWDGKQAALEVMRRPQGSPVEEEKSELPEAEAREIWRIVIANELRSFQPNKSLGEVFDFGERRFEIAVAPTMARRSVLWDAPIVNEEKIEPLFKAMAGLAARYAKQVRLYYFPSTERM
jgi:hypothetical protein